MTLQIYNTLSRENETFKPRLQDAVKVYFCWPTPYNFAHIGNLKTYVFEDVVIRTLRFLGYGVTTTMNITDIDDKTIRDSLKSGENLIDFTQKYTRIFFEDLEKLSVIKADNVAPISGLIPEMIQIINHLLKRGYAYLADDGSVYYSIKKFASYGKLAHLDFSGMKASVRINNDEYEKENVWDFVLWKAHDAERDGTNFWEGSFMIDGKEKSIRGRPGWHIECSACNLKYFWAEIDIHMWAVDLIFPHHQNEIAQSEACTGKKFSRYWMHGWHLTVDGKKMSKSSGSFHTLKDIEKHFHSTDKKLLYRALRLSFIGGKYRDTLDFSFEKLQQQINTIKKIDETLKKLLRASELTPNGKVSVVIRNSLQEYIQIFVEKLEDDINTPEALALFFDFQTFVNTQIDGGKLCKEETLAFIEMFRTFNQIFAIIDFTLQDEVDIPDSVLKLLEERNDAKKNKDFTQADRLREQLTVLGYKIIDDRSGSRVEKI
jgi:cysteinyl-tRNA synthetase